MGEEAASLMAAKTQTGVGRSRGQFVPLLGTSLMCTSPSRQNFLRRSPVETPKRG